MNVPVRDVPVEAGLVAFLRKNDDSLEGQLRLASFQDFVPHRYLSLWRGPNVEHVKRINPSNRRKMVILLHPRDRKRDGEIIRSDGGLKSTVELRMKSHT